MRYFDCTHQDIKSNNLEAVTETGAMTLNCVCFLSSQGGKSNCKVYIVSVALSSTCSSLGVFSFWFVREKERKRRETITGGIADFFLACRLTASHFYQTGNGEISFFLFVSLFSFFLSDFHSL